MRNLFGSLLLALSLVAGFAHALAAEPVAGRDYEVLKVAHPTSAPPGKVEVIEFFAYDDRGCHELETTIEAFVRIKGDRILFKRVPVAFEARYVPHSKLYYSLVQLGLEEKHAAVDVSDPSLLLMLTLYNAMWKNELLSMETQADFLATQGVDKRKFIDAYTSFTVISLEEQGEQLRGDYQIYDLPTFVVAGRYKIKPYHNNDDAMPRVLDYVVKQVLDKKL
jgi:protein dithiol oxidoreductase (disulfide-forming)